MHVKSLTGLSLLSTTFFAVTPSNLAAPSPPLLFSAQSPMTTLSVIKPTQIAKIQFASLVKPPQEPGTLASEVLPETLPINIPDDALVTYRLPNKSVQNPKMTGEHGVSTRSSDYFTRESMSAVISVQSDPLPSDMAVSAVSTVSRVSIESVADRALGAGDILGSLVDDDGIIETATKTNSIRLNYGTSARNAYKVYFPKLGQSPVNELVSSEVGATPVIAEIEERPVVKQGYLHYNSVDSIEESKMGRHMTVVSGTEDEMLSALDQAPVFQVASNRLGKVVPGATLKNTMAD